MSYRAPTDWKALNGSLCVALTRRWTSASGPRRDLLRVSEGRVGDGQSHEGWLRTYRIASATAGRVRRELGWEGVADGTLDHGVHADRNRNLARDLGGRVESLRFLLRDRDSKYTASFDGVFAAEEMKVLLSAPQAPRMNGHCERVIGTLRLEVLDHVLTMNEAHTGRVLAAYRDHYNRHRPHRSRYQQPPDAQEQTPAVPGSKASRLLRTGSLGSHQRVPLRVLSCSGEFSSPTGGRDGRRGWRGCLEDCLRSTPVTVSVIRTEPLLGCDWTKSLGLAW
ncbi:integrase core domain-containing protein [Kutzneria kofuensis]